MAIVNGSVLDNEDYPSVIRILQLSPKENDYSKCTATFITKKIAITAGHCVFENDYVYWHQSKDQKIEDMNKAKVITNWYQHNENQLVNPLDVALIEFQEEIGTVEFSIDFKPRAHSILKYVGYGSEKNPFVDVMAYLERWTEFRKNWGQSKISKESENHYLLLSNEARSFAASGDSGAPLIENDRIVGILNAAERNEVDGEYGVINYVLRLDHPLVQFLIEPYLK